MKMVKLSERQWAVIHFVATAAIAFLLPQLVHAQPADVTAAMDAGADTVLAISNHRFKTVLLFGCFVLNVVVLAVAHRLEVVWKIMVLIIMNSMFAVGASIFKV